MKQGTCILILDSGKWKCVKFHSLTKRGNLKYVPMHEDLFRKSKIKSIKFDESKVRSVYQGKGAQPLKKAEVLKWN